MMGEHLCHQTIYIVRLLLLRTVQPYTSDMLYYKFTAPNWVYLRIQGHAIRSKMVQMPIQEI